MNATFARLGVTAAIALTSLLSACGRTDDAANTATDAAATVDPATDSPVTATVPADPGMTPATPPSDLTIGQPMPSTPPVNSPETVPTSPPIDAPTSSATPR